MSATSRRYIINVFPVQQPTATKDIGDPPLPQLAPSTRPRTSALPAVITTSDPR